jgi:hypothetical protein
LSLIGIDVSRARNFQLPFRLEETNLDFTKPCETPMVVTFRLISGKPLSESITQWSVESMINWAD